MADLNVSRTGQINLAGDVDALNLKIFSGEVLTAYNVACVYQDKHMIREIASGKSAQFPATGKIVAGYHTPGTQLVGTPVAHNERVITIDDLLLASVMIADIDEAKSHYDVRSEYTRQLGEALAKAFDVNVARTAVLAARASATITGEPGGTQISGGANVRTDGALIKAALFSAAKAFDDNFVPEGDRNAFVKPVTYYAAAATTELVNKDWGGSPGGLASGKIETVAGINIVKTANLPNSNVTDGPSKYQGNFSTTAMSIFRRGAVGTVRLMNLSMQSEYLTLYQATALVARFAVGHGVLRPDEAIEVLAS